MNNGKPPVGFLGLGAAAPDKRLTNRDLEQMVDTNDEWIQTRTGIRERRIKSNGEGLSVYGALAAQRALKNAGVRAEDIGLIVCATYTPDEIMPSAACRIQERLGVAGAAAFDLNAACTGFIYALAAAKHMMQGGMARYALVIGADMCSAVVDYQDRATCVLFGDGAGAVVLGPVSEGRGILGEYIAADGSGADLIRIPAGGSRKPASAETIANREHFIVMAGNEVFKFAVKILGESVEKALEGTGCTVADIDYLAPHQANIRIIQTAAKRFGMPMERVLCNIERYGNTSGATIPLVLAEAAEEGKLKDDQLIALVGFGAGMTWGATIVRWGR